MFFQLFSFAFLCKQDDICCSVGMKLFDFIIILSLLLYSSHLFSLLFFHPYLFCFLEFFHYWFFVYMEFLISFQIQRFTSTYKVFLRHSLIVGSRMKLIMGSFLMQRINQKQHSIVIMLNCIHAHHVSNNINGAKPHTVTTINS